MALLELLNMLQPAPPPAEAAASQPAARGAAAAVRETEEGVLRRCALPACGGTEPHRRAFKVCARCRGAAYCCAAHSAEDWKRHKRQDGCAAPPK
jgi:hypothetical protein